MRLSSLVCKYLRRLYNLVWKYPWRVVQPGVKVFMSSQMWKYLGKSSSLVYKRLSGLSCMVFNYLRRLSSLVWKSWVRVDTGSSPLRRSE
jgi:hypothetical protein